jgi:hypothetical protein
MPIRCSIGALDNASNRVKENDMSTHPKGQSTDETPELDADALAAIRSMIAEAPRPDPVAQPVRGSEAPQQAVTIARMPTRPTSAEGDAMHKRTEQAPPEPAEQSAVPAEALADHVPGGLSRLLARVKDKVADIRVTPKRVALVALVALILFWPWLMVGILFFCAFIVTAIFLTLGYDGFWRRAMGLGRWYARRRPAHAAVIHEKLDTFAMRWDAVLDRFPEGTVDGLYLPDFGEMAIADSRHDAAMERRLNAMRENGA